MEAIRQHIRAFKQEKQASAPGVGPGWCWGSGWQRCLGARNRALRLPVPAWQTVLRRVAPWPPRCSPLLLRRPLPFSALQVDKIVVLWTANTERYSEVIEGLNDTSANLLASIERNEPEVGRQGKQWSTAVKHSNWP